MSSKLFVILRFIVLAGTALLLALFHVAADDCVYMFFMGIFFGLGQPFQFVKHNHKVEFDLRCIFEVFDIRAH